MHCLVKNVKQGTWWMYFYRNFTAPTLINKLPYTFLYPRQEVTPFERSAAIQASVPILIALYAFWPCTFWSKSENTLTNQGRGDRLFCFLSNLPRAQNTVEAFRMGTLTPQIRRSFPYSTVHGKHSSQPRCDTRNVYYWRTTANYGSLGRSIATETRHDKWIHHNGVNYDRPPIPKMMRGKASALWCNNSV